MPERLERSTTHRMWSGVCGGIAEYFQIDPTVVRGFFVIATILTGGLFLLVYIALLILMPLPGRVAPGEAGSTAPDQSGRRREGAGWLLIALGVVFLLANAGLFRFVQWSYVWPLVLIGIGALLILQRSRP